MVTITIDDREYQAEKGTSVLEVARTNDIPIPTLCYHPSLRPSGSCRLCAVEVPGRSTGRRITMLACVLKAEDGMVVKTRGEVVNRARTKAFRNLLLMAPQAKNIIALAKSHDIDPGPPPDGCVRCRLCVRVCKEIVGRGALKMEKRDGMNYVVPIKASALDAEPAPISAQPMLFSSKIMMMLEPSLSAMKLSAGIRWKDAKAAANNMRHRNS